MTPQNILKQFKDIEANITGIEEDVSNIKLNLAKIESSKKWYKNYTFILSLIAFTLSSFITLNTFFSTKNDKKIAAFNATLNSVISEINNLKTAEESFNEKLGNPSLDHNSKEYFGSIFNSKVSETMNDVSKKITKEIFDSLDVAILIDYSRYLSFIGKISESIDVDIKTLKKCRDKYNSIVILRSLSHLYSLPGDNQNIFKSRSYGNQAISTLKQYQGDYGKEIVLQTFMAMADDEYFNFNNKKNGNLLLDSATYYANSLQEHNTRKASYLKEITEMGNYYNDKLDINFNVTSWDVYAHSHLVGIANISFQNNVYTIDLDITKNDTLKMKIGGTGNFISSNELKFSVTSFFLEKIEQMQFEKNVNPYLPPTAKTQIQYVPQQKLGSLYLTMLDKKTINAKYLQLESTSEEWTFYLKNYF